MVLISLLDNQWWLQNLGWQFFFKYIVIQSKFFIHKWDTRYRIDVHIEVHVACVMYKLAQGYKCLICSEFFVINIFNMCLVIKEVIWTINIVFKKMVSWPFKVELEQVMTKFKGMCGLPIIHGVLDGTILQKHGRCASSMTIKIIIKSSSFVWND
jgi:hypothetical protein